MEKFPYERLEIVAREIDAGEGADDCRAILWGLEKVVDKAIRNAGGPVEKALYYQIGAQVRQLRKALEAKETDCPIS